MKNKYNMKYRPGSYWSQEDPLEAILEGVKGVARRKAIRNAWDNGNLEKLSDLVLKGKLNDQERSSLGKLHPSLMGGEYLPDYEPGQTTIVRILLQSVTIDVIELRARPQPDGTFRLKWIDEYNGLFRFDYDRHIEFDLPLTFEELVDYIDNSYCDMVHLPLGYNEENAKYESGDNYLNTLRHFTSVSSPFYPNLGAFYQDQADAIAEAAFKAGYHLEDAEEREEEEEYVW